MRNTTRKSHRQAYASGNGLTMMYQAIPATHMRQTATVHWTTRDFTSASIARWASATR